VYTSDDDPEPLLYVIVAAPPLMEIVQPELPPAPNVTDSSKASVMLVPALGMVELVSVGGVVSLLACDACPL
jgi:hypothetical protein